MSEQVYVARISTRASTLTYKHPQIPHTFKKPLDPRDSGKGWFTVTAEQAAILRKKKIGGRTDDHAPPLFDVFTQEEAIVFQQREAEKLGLGTAENPVGGSPAQMAKIRDLEQKLAASQATSAATLSMLTLLMKKVAPELLDGIAGATPETLALDLAPPVTEPASIHEKTQAPVVTAPQKPADTAPMKKDRPGAGAPAAPPAGAPAPKEKRQGPPRNSNDPASLTAKMRESGQIGDIPTDLSEPGANAEIA
jgi:hypothetical protein